MTLIFCALIYSLTVNLLSMFPDTMCLRFAGGRGCNADDVEAVPNED